MKTNERKNKKIKRLLYKNLSILIKKKIFDTRENIITITDINISNDFTNIIIFVSIIKNKNILLKFLNSSAIDFSLYLYKNVFFNKRPKIKFLSNISLNDINNI